VRLSVRQNLTSVVEYILHWQTSIMAVDRFEKICCDDHSKLCFLCLKESNTFCNECSLPYCSPSHLRVHKNNQQCYPFRVLQKPEVNHTWPISFSLFFSKGNFFYLENLFLPRLCFADFRKKVFYLDSRTEFLD